MKNKAYPFWGIDGCKTGWFCVGLSADGNYDYFVAKNIDEAHIRLQEAQAKIALIDIPIGLPSDKNGRECDKQARNGIGGRGSSVFSVPCRQAVEAYRKKSGDKKDKQKAGKIASIEITGGPLSEQTWGIVPKIVEVDFFLCENLKAQKLFREVHPEVCFSALNNKFLDYAKKDRKGHEERINIIGKFLPNAQNIFSDIEGYYRVNRHYKVADDDILDALAAAITAKIGDGNYKTLPKDPLKDSRGLPMEMVYTKLI